MDFWLEELYVTCAQTGLYKDPKDRGEPDLVQPTINHLSLEAQDLLSSMDQSTIQKKEPTIHNIYIYIYIMLYLG